MDSDLGASISHSRELELDHLLPEHHERLHAMCAELIACAQTGEPRELTRLWRMFEPELAAHMAAEEDLVVPGYAVSAPADAQQLLDEHTQIRAFAATIGSHTEPGEVCATRLRQLLDTLDAHFLQEDIAMYPWAARHLTTVAKRRVGDEILRWLHV